MSDKNERANQTYRKKQNSYRVAIYLYKLNYTFN